MWGARRGMADCTPAGRKRPPTLTPPKAGAAKGTPSNGETNSRNNKLTLFTDYGS